MQTDAQAILRFSLACLVLSVIAGLMPIAFPDSSSVGDLPTARSVSVQP
jgi:hypothetical protein